MFKKTFILLFNKLAKFEELKKKLGFSFVVVFGFFVVLLHFFCCLFGNKCARQGVCLLFGQSTMLFNELREF
jgi:hypothetical protein